VGSDFDLDEASFEMNAAKLARKDADAIVRFRVECELAVVAGPRPLLSSADTANAAVLPKRDACVGQEAKKPGAPHEEGLSGQRPREVTADTLDRPAVFGLGLFLVKRMERAPGVEQWNPGSESAPCFAEGRAVGCERFRHADGGRAQRRAGVFAGEELGHRRETRHGSP
jgi:hypothetical protein